MVEDEFTLPSGVAGAVGCIVFLVAGIVVAPVSLVVLTYATGGSWRVLLLAALLVCMPVAVGLGVVRERFLLAALVYAGLTAVSFGLLAITA